MKEMTDFIDALRDPYWLVREHLRIERLRAEADVRQKNEQIALCERVGRQLDSVPSLRLPVVEG